MILKILMALGLYLTAPVAVLAAPESRKDAALAWLALADRGAYAENWAASGDVFRSQITAEDWGVKVKALRDRLGEVVSRKLVTETETTSLPGAPAGRYDVVTFTTDFAKKPGSVETVIFMQEPSGWKVDGYFIR